MTAGLCTCHVGKNGSPCKHQYILWANNIASTINFVPYKDVYQRRKFGFIALGQTMPLDFYSGLHQDDDNFYGTECNSFEVWSIMYRMIFMHLLLGPE